MSPPATRNPSPRVESVRARCPRRSERQRQDRAPEHQHYGPGDSGRAGERHCRCKGPGRDRERRSGGRHSLARDHHLAGRAWPPYCLCVSLRVARPRATRPGSQHRAARRNADCAVLPRGGPGSTGRPTELLDLCSYNGHRVSSGVRTTLSRRSIPERTQPRCWSHECVQLDTSARARAHLCGASRAALCLGWPV